MVVPNLMRDSSCEATVFLVDDDEAARESLVGLLEASGFAVSAFGNATAFLSAVRPGGRGCVVLDVRLPDRNGLEVLGELMALGIRLPVVMITAYADVPLAVAAMRAGATDFLEKPYAEEALLASIQNALRSDAMAAETAEDIRAVNARIATLTPRERDVLDRLLAGRQNKQTAYDLGISPRTVEIHRSRVMEKMGATSLSHLVRLILRARGNVRTTADG